MRLTTDEFIRRFLIHVLPTGFHRIRPIYTQSNQYRVILEADPSLPRGLELARQPPAEKSFDEGSAPGAFFDFAVAELVELFGSRFRARVRPLVETGWARDPLAQGSYSYALPGYADSRGTLAAPVDGRLFFAGEACSPHDFTTAHGAYLSGVEAADETIALRPRGI